MTDEEPLEFVDLDVDYAEVFRRAELGVIIFSLVCSVLAIVISVASMVITYQTYHQ